MTKFVDFKAVFQLPTRSWTLEEYHAMIEAGILTPEDRVELIFGQIVETSPVGSAHSTAVKKITKLFHELLGEERVVIGVQDPVTLLDDSEPEPDVFLARGVLEDYVDHHPHPADLMLIIEVSDSTLDKDRRAKKANYARAGITEYWVIDVFGRKLYRYTRPDQEERDYGQLEELKADDTISLLNFGEILVADLLIDYR